MRCPGGLFFGIEFRRGSQWLAVLTFDDQTALLIGRDTTGNDHADTTRRTLGIKSRHPLEAVWLFL
jgi:hypothetical protein